jgi:FMN phosphatase YigB (HAD superfamily)
MRYFVFDLDETLAEVSSAYHFIAALKLKDSLLELNPHMAIHFPKELEKQLNHAYQLFVDRIEQQESSDDPIGIIRPGILQIMDDLNKLKKEGKIKGCVIYSNNSHLPSLEFIRDVIHKHTNSKRLILDCIHRLHYLRKNNSPFYSNYSYNKTWVELKKIMVECDTRAPHSIMPENVFFFDDQEHEDLEEQLNRNYYRVPRYSYKARTDRIYEIYKGCLEFAKVDMSAYLFYINQVFMNKASGYSPYGDTIHTFSQSLDIIRATLEFIGLKMNNNASAVPKEDYAIGMIQQAIKQVKDKYRRSKIKLLSARVGALTYKRRK